MDLIGLLIGRRLANRESDGRRIGTLEAVPAMGLDALGSSAYGPEAAMTILAPLGAAALDRIDWVVAPIAVVLAMLFLSYRQTLAAFPSSGGAYVVAKESLGTGASLLAAAALLVDYVLNVAVGIAAGVGALVSVVPALHAHTLSLCLGILAAITLVNLRGTPESGRVLAVPTYLFIASFALLLAIGVAHSIATGGHPHALVAPAPLATASASFGAWLLLRAFAAGCTAMTGVEAVSNGMGVFREPRAKYGRRTLAVIVVTLGVFLIGIGMLVRAYRIGAMDQSQAGYRSVLEQLAGAIVGHTALYYVALFALLAVLALSANTSFVAFPRLCRALAVDGFLPAPFAIAGRRLVYSIGLLFLAGSAALLIAVFGGITDRLIPLFAVGAFLGFTISQVAMAAHWRKRLRSGEATGGDRQRLVVNAAGAAITAIALVIIVAAKFVEGAWIVVLLIPCVAALLRAMRRYYDAIYAAVSESAPIDATIEPPVIVVAIEAWNRLSHNAVQLALAMSDDVVGVHLADLEGPRTGVAPDALRALWRRHVEHPVEAAGRAAPRLVVLQSEHRTLHEPLLKLVREVEAMHAGRAVAVLVPRLIERRWYRRLLHARRERRLRAELIACGDARVTIVEVPWHVGDML